MIFSFFYSLRLSVSRLFHFLLPSAWVLCNLWVFGWIFWWCDRQMLYRTLCFFYAEIAKKYTCNSAVLLGDPNRFKKIKKRFNVLFTFHQMDDFYLIKIYNWNLDVSFVFFLWKDSESNIFPVFLVEINNCFLSFLKWNWILLIVECF